MCDEKYNSAHLHIFLVRLVMNPYLRHVVSLLRLYVGKLNDEAGDDSSSLVPNLYQSLVHAEGWYGTKKTLQNKLIARYRQLAWYSHIEPVLYNRHNFVAYKKWCDDCDMESPYVNVLCEKSRVTMVTLDFYKL